MTHRRIAGLQSPDTSKRPVFEVVGPTPQTWDEARDMAYLASLLLRWHRLLAACDGDVEQAQRVLADAERVRAPL